MPLAAFRDRPAQWTARFARLLPFFIDAVESWAAAEEAIGPVGYRRLGGLLVGATPEEMVLIERKALIERAAGLPTKLLSASALYEREPELRTGFLGGAFTAAEGDCDPALAVTRFASAARAAGADVRTEVAVQAVKRTGDAVALHTTGGTIRTTRVINATGARLSCLSPASDMRGHPIQLMETVPTKRLVRHLLYAASDKLTLKQRADGRVMIGGGWAAKTGRDGSAEIDDGAARRNLYLATRLVPSLEGVPIAQSWAFEVNGNDSWMPIIDETAPDILALGMPWLGITAGPRLGEIACRWAKGEASASLRREIGCS